MCMYSYICICDSLGVFFVLGAATSLPLPLTQCFSLLLIAVVIWLGSTCIRRCLSITYIYIYICLYTYTCICCTVSRPFAAGRLTRVWLSHVVSAFCGGTLSWRDAWLGSGRCMSSRPFVAGPCKRSKMQCSAPTQANEGRDYVVPLRPTFLDSWISVLRGPILYSAPLHLLMVVDIYIYIYIYMQVYMYIYIYIYIYMFIYIYMQIHIRHYIYIYIYIYI